MVIDDRKNPPYEQGSFRSSDFIDWQARFLATAGRTGCPPKFWRRRTWCLLHRFGGWILQPQQSYRFPQIS